MEFDKISFRLTEQEKLLFQHLQQKYQVRTKTELMHAFLADYIKNTSIAHSPGKGRDSNILTLQDYPFLEIAASNLSLGNNPLLLMMMLDREEERERQQRILAEKKAESEMQHISGNQKSMNSSVRQFQDMADCAEACNRFKRAWRGL